MSELATKADLKRELEGTKADLKRELEGTKADLKRELENLEVRLDQRLGQRLEQQLEQRLGQLKRELFLEIGHAIQVGVEQFSTAIGVVDEKYQDLPAETRKLRRDLDAHSRDPALHKKPRAAGAKRR